MVHCGWFVLSSVARGGRGGSSPPPPPPLACEVCKIAPFWWFWGKFLWKLKITSPIGKQPPSNVRIFELGQTSSLKIGEDLFFVETTWFWAKKSFEFEISAENSVSKSVKTFFFFFFFFWRPSDFGRNKPLNFRGFREISSQVSCKPCETDSRAMKIRVKVVCTLLTLSK